jgi:fucose permease
MGTFLDVALLSLSATIILHDTLLPRIVKKTTGGCRLRLFSLFLTLAAFAISANAVAPLISTLSGSLGVPASSFGLLITLQFAVFAAVSFAGGVIKERLRLSNYHLVSAGLAIIAAAFFVAAAALHSLAALVIWVVPLGIAGSAVETFSSIEISTLSRPGSSRNLCLSQVFYSIGAFAAPQLVYVMLGSGLSWKMAFVIFGLFSAVVFALFLGHNLPRGSFAAAGPAAAPSAEAVRARGAVLPAMMLLMLVAVMLESASASWLSYVFEVQEALTARDAALVLALFWVGMLAGRFSIALLPVRLALWPALGASAVGVLAVTASLAFVPQVAARHVLVVLLGFFLGPMWPVIVMTSTSTFQSEKLTSAVIGVGAMGFAAGPLVGSFLLGLGWIRRFFLVHLGLGLLVAASCLIAWRLAVGVSEKNS